MGYLFLSFALFAGVTKGYCGKKTSGLTKGISDAILANILRMVFCLLIGFALILAKGSLPSLLPSPALLAISALSGGATALFVVSWLISVRKSAYMMLDIFLMLGILIPLIGSRLLFAEQISLLQWIGIGVLFGAVLLMCSYHNSIKEKLSLPALLLLLLSGIANGIADFSQKIFVKTIEGVDAAVFNFYTYLFAGIALLVAFLFSSKNEKTDSEGIKKSFWYIAIMAACLFANSYFKTLAAGLLPSVLLYPLNQGCALILSSAMSAILFKERLTPKAILGIAIAFAGLLIINLS